MRHAWAGWVALWDRREPPLVLAVVRVLMALVLLYDFLYLRHLGLVEVLFSPQEVGGLPDVHQREVLPAVYGFLPESTATAWTLWWAMVGCLVALGLGFVTPVAALGAALVSAQLGQILPLGDRGIDTLLRNMLVLFAFSPAGRVWSVDAWIARAVGRPFRPDQPAWARSLVILQLALMYFLAGVQKTALAWTPIGGFSALYSILQDPSIARHRFGWLAEWYPLTQLASASTMFFEYTACLLPLAFWYRHTRTRPGRLRAWFNTHQPVRLWLLVGVGLHVGIAATMQLGIFPWAMLSFYPAFLHPDEWRALGRRWWGVRQGRGTVGA